MKTIIFSLFFILSTSLFSQNKSESFHFNSLEISPGLYLAENTGGPSLNIEAGFSFKKNLFTLSASLGSALNVLGGDTEGFYSINALYGRTFLISKNLELDTYVGAGFFSYETDFDPEKRGYERSNTVGFPVSVRFRYQLSDHFSLGIKAEENFNSLELLFNTGVVVQWNFN